MPVKWAPSEKNRNPKRREREGGELALLERGTQGNCRQKTLLNTKREIYRGLEYQARKGTANLRTIQERAAGEGKTGACRTGSHKDCAGKEGDNEGAEELTKKNTASKKGKRI